MDALLACQAKSKLGCSTKCSSIPRFLGLAAYDRIFIQGSSGVAAPLHDSIQKDVKFKWTDKYQQFFDWLKELLCLTPNVAYLECFLISGRSILDIDTSNQAIGGVLPQFSLDRKTRVILYGSRILRKSEKNIVQHAKRC